MLKIKILNKSMYGDDALPKYMKKGDAGADVRANIVGELTLLPFERVLVPTGIYMDIPEGFEIQVRSRSGLSLKKGLIVLNSPGTVDSNYTGEIGVILINLSQEPQTISPNERVAQLVCCAVETVDFEKVNEITKETERGSTGYGKSGTN